MVPESNVRVRLAPSPTGFLHIGTAQSAVYNWLFARKNGGTFIVRIEDTDRARSEKQYEDDILAGLKELKLEWGELYRQSERTEIYEEQVNNLLASGKAFWCRHTPEELETERQAQLAGKDLPRHVCAHRENPSQRDGGVIRLHIDSTSNRTIVVDDVIRGKVEFAERLFGDISIARTPDNVLFHFANVVDDGEMRISHVIRGEDHLANTPKHILIAEALGFQPPRYAHLPLLLAPDRTKLSKRHGATSLKDYMNDFLPDAIFNYLAVLSFTPPAGKEIISREELMEVFELEKVHKTGAVFDIKKLEWINGEYIKKLSDDELLKKLSGDKVILQKLLPMIRERVKKFSDISEFDFFFKTPDVDPELLTWKKSTPEESRTMLGKVEKVLEECDWNKEAISYKLEAISKETGDRGLVYWPLRVALSGKKASPDPVDIAVILGKEETLRRIEAAIKRSS